jgi:membrane dipeptidase
MRPCFLLPVVFASITSCTPFFRTLHRQSIVVDTHNDVLSQVTLRGLNMEEDLTGRAHSDLRRWQRGGVDIQVFSVFCDERFGRDTAFDQANIQIDSLLQIIGRNDPRMMLVTDAASLQQAVKQQKLGCMIGVEGGHMIEDNLQYLDSLFRRGARYLTLTWNNSTSWASSAKDEAAGTVPNAAPGLNAFGRSVVRRMNELGMLVDVSHVGEKTFYDVLQSTTKPVIASHSCAYRLCPHPRNLKDEQIKAIAANGGVIHLNFYSGFVDSTYIRRKMEFLRSHAAQSDSLKALGLPDYEVDDRISKMYPAEAEALRPDLSLLIDHLDHIVKLVGVDHVGLGSDFDGIESAPRGLDDVASFPLITEALLQRGYRKKDIPKILGGNFIRVLRENEVKTPKSKP